jgi:hypothetical protein
MHELNAHIIHVLEFDCIKCGEPQELFIPGSSSPHFCWLCAQIYHITVLPEGKIRVEYSYTLPEPQIEEAQHEQV